MGIILKTEHLTKIYRPFWGRLAKSWHIKSLEEKFAKKSIVAVEDFSIEVEAGEIVGLIGPNGAGKTTFLKLITGLIRPESGDAFIDGHSITKERTAALSCIGGIIETPEMYRMLSGKENLYYLAELQGGVSKERIAALAEHFKMTERLKDKYQSYSLGMKQRMGIIQAIMHRPKLLILDEPTNGLDPQGIMEMREMLRQLAKEENMAIIISSHMLLEVEEICDKVIIIGKGKLLKIGSTDDVSESVSEQDIVKFTCDDAEKAAKIAESIGIIGTVDGALFVCNCKADDVAKLTKEFVLNGVLVYGVNIQKANLEKAFARITEEASK